jgi:DNA-directed RNA polymerase sigma subunit (sigma70/sigma32)
LRQLYGLAGENPRNYTEIAKNLGVSRQRIRQNFEEAVGKLMENPDFRQLIEEFQTKDACNRKHC